MNLIDKIATKPQIAKELQKIGITTVKELLLYYPRRYIDFSNTVEIKHLTEKSPATIKAKVIAVQSRFVFKTRRTVSEIIIGDKTGTIKVVWFNMPWVAKSLAVGDFVAFAGKPVRYKGLQLINPIYEKITADQVHTGRLVPIYKLPTKIPPRTFRKLIYDHLSAAKQLTDIIPTDLLREYGLLTSPEVTQNLHFPETQELVTRAQSTLAFSEIFIKKLAAEVHKSLQESRRAVPIKADIKWVKNFLKKLPFTPTDDQKKALWQVMKDIENIHPMNRMVLGDVGSGKTLVAAAAAGLASSQKSQVAILAPTELLARQHYDSFQKYFASSKIKDKIALLTQNYALSSDEDENKKSLNKKISTSKVHIVIGTHALLGSKVSFANLSLIIIDEQHRFGVKQRKTLTEQDSLTPHLLSMSATPIPRTLALSIFGELNISRIIQMPKGRKQIETRLMLEDERETTYKFIAAQIKKGHQVFVVVPRIEEDEEETKANVEAKLEEMRYRFSKAEMVHGKMKAADREKVMQDFAARKFPVLVATTVIEIGIDIPNSTVMVIEDAENFGLAQLHQLRGRVGRSDVQSYCFVFTSTENEASIDRLKSFCEISNGFELSEIDLQTRGFGSLYGIEQSGFDFKYPKYITTRTLVMAKKATDTFNQKFQLKNFPELKKEVMNSLPDIHLE